MKTVLLDTNIVSYIFKQDSRYQLYEPHLKNKALVTVGELYQWAYVNQWGTRRIARLEQVIQQYMIIPFDLALCQRWEKVRAIRRHLGQPILGEDAWVAATALQYQLPLVTHNPRDFLHVDITVITEAAASVG